MKQSVQALDVTWLPYKELTNVGFSNGVGFARAGLPIGKNRGIETIKEGLDQRLNAVSIHILLCRALLKHKVTVEVAAIA